MYHGEKIILATKHQKEIAIKKPFEDGLSVELFVPTDFDSDKFGTFTGEIERQANAHATVIQKAKAAALAYGFEFGIASEGSFGPHPTAYFVPADIELISFVDLKNDLIIVESIISTDTNYAHIDITVQDDYMSFLQRIRFPSHGIIIRSLDDHTIIAKGITDSNALSELLPSTFITNKSIRLETDMRAMFNPTRMKVINQLAIKLVERIKTHCKRCNTPGFGKAGVIGHLACSTCGADTELYKYRLLSCIKCDYSETYPRTDNLELAEPTHCSYCNP